MSFSDDSYDEMSGVPLDDGVADALLEGRVAPDDAPPGWRQFATFVRAARGPARPDELAREQLVTDAMVAEIRAREEDVSHAHDEGRSSVLETLRKLHVEKIVPVVAAVVLGGSAVATAATGPAHRPGLRSAPSVARVPASHRTRVPTGRGVASHRTLPPSGEVLVSHRTLVPVHRVVAGRVTAVGGVATSGTCGAAGAAGDFTLSVARRGRAPLAVTVDVTGTTTFTDGTVAAPTFADVCVGDEVAASGTFSADPATVAARWVTVVPPPSTPPPVHRVVAGRVTAVGGVATSGTCGAAGAAGDFTLGLARRGRAPAAVGARSAVTVDVTGATTFTDGAVAAPTFADVCVGDEVAASGTLSASPPTLAATTVAVLLSLPRRHHWPHETRAGHVSQSGHVLAGAARPRGVGDATSGRPVETRRPGTGPGRGDQRPGGAQGWGVQSRGASGAGLRGGGGPGDPRGGPRDPRGGHGGPTGGFADGRGPGGSHGDGPGGGPGGGASPGRGHGGGPGGGFA